MKGGTLSIPSQPYGGTTAPAVLSTRRSDQPRGDPNALMYELSTKFAAYVDTSSGHIRFWMREN